MNWLDIVLAPILIGSALAGLMKGLIRTVVGMITAIAAVVLSLWFYAHAAALFSDYTKSAAMANALGFVAVFLGVFLIGMVTTRVLAAIFKWVGLSWMDRLLGGVFGLVRGLIFSTAIVMAVMAFTSHPPPRSIVESEIAPYVLEAARVASNLAPEELKLEVEKNYQKIKDVWADAWKKGLMEKALGK